MAANHRSIAFLCLTAVLTLHGCTTPRGPLYHWGNYETVLYQQYQRPGEAGPREQILRLREDVRNAELHGLRVAPGVYAQLGYAYLANGESDTAAAHFALEKQHFPESSVLMDMLIARIHGPAKGPAQ